MDSAVGRSRVFTRLPLAFARRLKIVRMPSMADDVSWRSYDAASVRAGCSPARRQGDSVRFWVAAWARTKWACCLPLDGGTAATLAMEQAGLEFRATKDLDIVLHIEVLNPAFGTAFWDFVETGGYGIRESSEAGKPVLYRFQKPADDAHPFMLELFCGSPDGIRLAESSQLMPIPLAESVSSLSAILLDDFYYRFIHEGV